MLPLPTPAPTAPVGEANPSVVGIGVLSASDAESLSWAEPEPEPGVPTLELPVGIVPLPPSTPVAESCGKTVIVIVVVLVDVIVLVGSTLPPEGAGVTAPSKPVGELPEAVNVMV